MTDWNLPSQPQPTPPQSKSHLPMMLGAVVAVVALVAGGLVFANARGWFAASGASTPGEAVDGLFESIASGDLLGIADQLAPSEARLSAEMSGDFLGQLKRLEIVQSSATVDQLYSINIDVDGITIAEDPLRITDHIQIVEVTGGIITVETSGTISSLKDVLTPKILDALPDITAEVAAEYETFNIAQDTDEIGGSLRIATIEENGRWYPSLMYTIADLAAVTGYGSDYASRLSPIPASGAATPQLAMDNLVDALIGGDVSELVAVLDPGTLGALQDYIGLVFADDPAAGCLWNGVFGSHGDEPSRTGACESADVRVLDAEWMTSEVTSGTKVTIGSLTLQAPDGVITVLRDPAVPSLTVSAEGEEPMVIDASTVEDLVRGLTSGFGLEFGDIDEQARDIVAREFDQILGLGVIMVQGGDDLWYVSPIHSYMDVFLSLLDGLEPADIDYFLALAHE